MNQPTIEQIAMIVHDALRRYSSFTGEDKPEWGALDEDRKRITVEGVRFHFSNPDATPAEAHQQWVEEKTKSGWVFSEEYSDERKTHPHLLPFYALTKYQRTKAFLIKEMVGVFVPSRRNVI
jgi:hypothetical protein